jgi:hypothetical protein
VIRWAKLYFFQGNTKNQKNTEEEMTMGGKVITTFESEEVSCKYREGVGFSLKIEISMTFTVGSRDAKEKVSAEELMEQIEKATVSVNDLEESKTKILNELFGRLATRLVESQEAKT